MNLNPQSAPSIVGQIPQANVDRSYTGFDLFFGDFERASVHLPGFSFHSHATSGLRDTHVSIHAAECSVFWRTIQSPPVDLNIILARQEAVNELITKIAQTQSIHRGMYQGYSLHPSIDKLLDVTQDEMLRSMRGDSPPRNRIQQVIEEHSITADNLMVKLEELRSTSVETHERDSDEPTPIEILEAILTLEPARKAVMSAFAIGEKFHDTNLLQMIDAVQASAVAVGPLTPERLFLAATDPQEGAALLRSTAAFSEMLANFGALCSFASLAASDRYCKTTFDISRDDQYEKAWNLLREKEGHKASWGSDAVEPQVKCHSPSAMEHVVLCGSNMAGKTFFLQRDLVLRLSAQSFGFAPAKSANIHPADSFVWVERTSPSRASVQIQGVEKKPSDFCREILVRNEAYTHIGKRCLWYSDESWTTTSPNYEFLLNLAEDRYLAGRNVRRFTVSHNSAVLAFWEKQSGTSVHHFEIKDPEGNSPQFTRKLVPGLDPSHAFDVARALGLDSRFLALGEQYLSGRYEALPAPEREVKIKQFEPIERERLKAEARSFRSLIGQSDELVVEHGRFGDHVRVRWRSDVEGLTSRDEHYTPLADGHPAWSNLYRFPFLIVSQNYDHFPLAQQMFRFAKDFQFRATDFISGLLRHGITADSRELIERRQMFAELARPGVLEHLREKLTHLERTIQRLDGIGYIELKDFPRVLLKAIEIGVEKLESFGTGFNYRQSVEALKLVRLCLNVIRAHSTPTNQNPADPLLEKLARIEKLEERKQELYESHIQTRSLKVEERQRLHDEGVQVDREISDLGGVGSEQMSKYLKAMVGEIKSLLEPSLSVTPLSNIDVQLRASFVRDAAPYLNPQTAAMWTMPLRQAIALVSYANDNRRPVGDFLDGLRSTDSVHLNQYANYLDPILRNFLDPEATGDDIVAAFIATNADQHGRVEIQSDKIGKAASNSNNGIVLRYELDRLEGLLCIAQAIRDGDFAAVNFHAGRELSILNGWNIVEAPSRQVRHDRSFELGQQVEFSTGANMSGKSFDQVGLTWSLAMAQATGWAPGTEAQLPIFDQIVHIERVRERTDLNLSAFGTEVYYWKPVLERIQHGGRSYLAADEPFSSTSSRYRNPFNFAVAALAAQSDALTTIATHCQPPVEHFIQVNPGRARATHFETVFDQAGEFSFTYIKREGIADSYALEVGAALSYPREILEIARALPTMSEFEALVQ